MPLITRSNLGVRVYGLAAVALGLVGLVWGDFATVWQPVPPDFPHRELLAYIAAAIFLCAGAAIQWRRTARAGLLILGVLNLFTSLLWMPRVIGFPGIFGVWSGFAEEYCLVAAAMAAYALLLPRPSVNAERVARVGCILFGICVLSFGIEHFSALPQTIAMVPKWIPPGQRFWAMFTGVAHLLAGAAIITGIWALLASRLLTAMLIVFGLLVWLPSLAAQPHEHMVWAGNAVNLTLISAAWVIADSIASRRSDKTGIPQH